MGLTNSEKMKKYKYHAKLQESCSNGVLVYAFGDTITELRKNLYEKYFSTNWHKTASAPIINVNLRSSAVHPYGMWIAQVRVDENIWRTRTYLVWEPNNRKGNWDSCRVIEEDGTLGLAIKTVNRRKY